jgi:16S rRNA A1518/A1519 N6-dimethyltransferase RsmA/KsgA/DIM1 with predicted DNA glycosylase/AP lyase activity
MSERKTEVVNLRMSRRVKELLRLAAAHERRTLSNMLEVLIEDYCQDHQIEPDSMAEAKSPTDLKKPAQH